MKFTLNQVKKIAEDALTLNGVGHSLLDEKYDWYTNLVGHINPYYRFMYLLTKEFKPKLFVELGTYRATASSHAAHGNPNGIVVTIDIHKDDPDAQKDTLRTAGEFPNLHYINGWTWDVVDRVGDIGIPIDILFIDSWHEKQYAQKDWDLFSPLLADEALVIIDDIVPFEWFLDSKEWFDSLPGEHWLEDAKLHPGIPMGFIRLKKETKKVGTKRIPKTK